MHSDTNGAQLIFTSDMYLLLHLRLCLTLRIILQFLPNHIIRRVLLREGVFLVFHMGLKVVFAGIFTFPVDFMLTGFAM